MDLQLISMSQRQWIVIVGVWIMFFLFLGVPFLLKEILAILTGLLVIIMAYRIKLAGSSPVKEDPADSSAVKAPEERKPGFSKEKNPVFPLTPKDLSDKAAHAIPNAEK